MRRLLLIAVLLAAGCHKSNGPRRCYADYDCRSGKVCVALSSGAQTCVDTCDAAVDIRCVDGAACVSLDDAAAGEAVCLPGGETVDGDACAVSADCRFGSICLNRPGSLGLRCESLCSLAEIDGCGDVGSCEPVDDDPTSDRGTCTAF